MSAKLRVGWIVAGCAPGVRTIARSILFHCSTGLGVEAAGPFAERCPSSVGVGAAKQFGDCVQKAPHNAAVAPAIPNRLINDRRPIVPSDMMLFLFSIIHLCFSVLRCFSTSMHRFAF